MGGGWDVTARTTLHRGTFIICHWRNSKSDTVDERNAAPSLADRRRCTTTDQLIVIYRRYKRRGRNLTYANARRRFRLNVITIAITTCPNRESRGWRFFTRIFLICKKCLSVCSTVSRKPRNPIISYRSLSNINRPRRVVNRIGPVVRPKVYVFEPKRVGDNIFIKRSIHVDAKFYTQKRFLVLGNGHNLPSTVLSGIVGNAQNPREFV